MKMLSLLTAVVLFSGAAVSNAAEPVALTDNQLDSVTAGIAFADAVANASAAGRYFAATYTETYTEATSESGSSTAISYSRSSSAAY